MFDSFRYGIALLCVLTLPFAFGYWFLVHPFVGFWRALGTRISYIILIGMFWVVGATTWPFRGRLLAVEFGTGPTLWPLAALANGTALFSNYLASWILLVITVPALLLIVHFEERELRDRFGNAYVEYARRVPRFVPRSTA